MKPYEVEILVAQVGVDPDEHDELFRILYDGTVMDEDGFTVLGGQAETITEVLEQRYEPGLDLGAAIRLGATCSRRGDAAPLAADQLEVALLDRARPAGAFRRIKGAELEALLAG